MTLADQDVPVLAWNEPDGLIARGTVVVIPGRGELPTVYERFGRRLAGDAYRVRVVADPVVDAELAREQISGLVADPSLPAPRVLAGSDTGALFAIMLARSGLGAAVDALLLAGLPATSQAGSAASWEEELNARTFCPTHRGRLTASAVRRGALYEPIPADWLERADLDGLGVLIPAGLWSEADCGPGAAGTMMSGPGAAVGAAKYGGWGAGACRDQYPPGGQPELPGTRLWLPEPERSVLHMC